MDAARKMTQARSNLILEEAFFGTLAMRLELIPDPSKPTMSTNGKYIKYNPAYVDKLTLKEVEGDICHEVLHVSNGHCWREGGRDHDEWNEACDYAINWIIKDAGLILPEDPPVLFDPEFAGMSAESIYSKRKQKKLEQQAQQPQQGDQDPQQQEQQQSGGGGAGKAPQDAPEEASEQGDGEEQEQESGDDQGSSESLQGQQKGSSGGSSEQQRPPSCGEVEQCFDEDVEALEAEWEVATFQAAQAAMARGELPGGLKYMVDKLREQKVDWKAALLRFMQMVASADYSWKQPNRRYVPLGIYLPALRSESMPPVVIGWDTSMSTYEHQEQFATELDAAIRETKPERTHVVYCDAKVQRVDEFGPDDTINFDPPGGGGTDFRPVFEWVEREGIEPACLIFFTDLDGPAPQIEPGYPVLWCCVNKQRGPWGETINLPTDEGR